MRHITLPLYALCVLALSACTPSQQAGAAKGAAAGGLVTAIMGGDKETVVRGALAGGVVGGIFN